MEYGELLSQRLLIVQGRIFELNSSNFTFSSNAEAGQRIKYDDCIGLDITESGSLGEMCIPRTHNIAGKRPY